MNKCLKCQSEMEAGWIRDYESTRPIAWIPGVPEMTWIGAAKKPEKSLTIPLTVYRCKKCGFVEFYA